MNRLPTPQAAPELDAALARLFAAPPPSPAFVDLLEQRLLAQAKAESGAALARPR